MPTLSDLLNDPAARVELVIKGEYLDENDVLQTEWVSQNGWDDLIEPFVMLPIPYTLAGTYIPPLLATTLRINFQIEPLEPLSSFSTFGDIEISNNHLDYAGRYDSWWKCTVDGLNWTVYAVGILSNGERVDLVDVEDTPLFELKGIAIPEVGSDTVRIRTRDRNSFDPALQPVTYSPPALHFPGTVAGALALGNNINITGVQSISVWVYLEDVVSTAQFILHKDSGAAGYYLAVGLVGGGTIIGGVEIGVRGQTPAVTTTAANVIKPFRWHRIDISIDTTSRRIDIDGTTAITTAGITGTPTTTTTVLTVGRSLLGRMHRLLYWSNARSNATMSAEGRTPITGAETNLREAFLFAEGSGTTTASIKSGSSLVATLGTNTLWDTATWHYDSILGQYEPYVLGTVPRVPVTWIDPPRQIGQISRGAIALLSELQSNHSAVSTANYTVNLSNGTITVTVGALSGTYSATVTAHNLWNSAALFNGSTSKATATVTMPAASKYIGCHFRLDTSSNTFRHLLGWLVGAPNSFFIRMNNAGTNIISVLASNDAGTFFTASSPTSLVEKKRYSVIASLDTANPSTGLKLYVNGALVATTPISGNWTGTQPTMSAGFRLVGNDHFFTGPIDEIVVGNTACSLAMAQAYHSIPSTSTMTGIIAGWHLDDATGLTGAPFVGAASLTLTATTWTNGRSAPTDLARAILYAYGKSESDLDSISWLDALIDNSADCGWFVSGGVKGIDVLNIILGGLGFILYQSPGSTIKIKRFEGLSGIHTDTLDTDSDLQAQPIEGLPSDPAIYLWIVNFATNNTRQDQANIAGGLATTDPDRYQYGATAHKSVPRSDGAILDRFPNAETRTRMTALLNMIDAENEAVRLLGVHRHGADRKSLQAFLRIAEIEILDEIGPLTEECDLDASDLIVTGISTEDGVGTITVWRPAVA